MKFNDLFYKQSKLLITVLPYVSEETCFALKGGTAINFFIQNMPRLSVDIDLAFLPILPREQSLTAINLAMQRIGQKIQSHFPDIKIAIDIASKNVVLPKLFVRQKDVEIKVEVNPIFRGSIFAPEIKHLCNKAQTTFESFLEMSLSSIADIYAGKFCAALNRQHPRDLYDVQLFMTQQGIPENVRQAFVIYLACDRRPIHELLLPNIKPQANQEKIFHSEFSGMVVEPIEHQNLAGVINNLSVELRKQLTRDEKNFLLSVADGELSSKPQFFPDVENLPAMQWKLLNIRKMDSAKRKQAYMALENCFNSISTDTINICKVV